MVPVNLKSLVSVLNDTCRRSLEAAAGLCMSRTHYNVEIEHWLVKLLEGNNNDLQLLLKAGGVDSSHVLKELTRCLDQLKSGNARPPGLAPSVTDAARDAWLLASLEFNSGRTRSGHVLLALLSDEGSSRALRDSAPSMEKLSLEALRKEFPRVAESSSEHAESAAAASGGGPGPGPRPAGPGGGSSLDQFTIDLTARAKAGKIDPVLGRDSEIRQVVDILMRRRQNNPILTGEAGVGKTAVVEGFALRISQGDVPPPLKNVTLRTLDLGLLQAGAGMKGEFENRLKSVIEEVKSAQKPIILFIDEAHTMIGAGGQAGQNDAANLLKPALARGELRTIAATTWAEYKKYFERDAALARRFQVVKVEEPSESTAVEMMRGLVGTMEEHHKVRVLDEAVGDAVRLSHRYLSGRQLPDKAVSLLDTACAKVAIGLSATPPAVEDCRRRIEQLDVAVRILEREAASGAEHGDRIARMVKEREEAKTTLKSLEARWDQEKKLVGEIQKLRGQLEAAAAPAPKSAGPAPAGTPPPIDREKTRGELDRHTQELKKLQGETPLLSSCVDSQAVAEVLSGWTGIPAGRMVSDQIKTVLTLKDRMKERLIGQDHALEAIAQAIRTSRANLTDPRRPIGVFLLVGTSGVGKTETAVTLADLLYGGEQNMTVINMSEFKEEHKVSLLMGSPPGYVGYGEGGILTEAVRRKPYSVVLLDEMEKAHPGVQDIFYQVFDKGMLRDGEGRDIDFKNTVILMTSNAGTDAIMKLCADPETMPDPTTFAEALRPELLKTFKPAFLGRVNLVPFFPLKDDVLRGIIELKLGKVKRRVEENYRASFAYGPELVVAILSRCKEVESGARNVDHIINRSLLPQLAAEFLGRMAEGQAIRSVHVSVDKGGNFLYTIS